MPTYDYHCLGCGEQFEARVDGPRSRPACPRCAQRRARREISMPAVRGGSPAAPTLPIRGRGACGCGGIERTGHKGH